MRRHGTLTGPGGVGKTTLAWAKVLHGSALQHWGSGEVAQAAAREEPAVQIFRSAGDSRWLSYGLAPPARTPTFKQPAVIRSPTRAESTQRAQPER